MTPIEWTLPLGPTGFLELSCCDKCQVTCVAVMRLWVTPGAGCGREKHRVCGTHSPWVAQACQVSVTAVSECAVGHLPCKANVDFCLFTEKD